ncbi:MAG: glycosyltransferase family 2 protein [Opitutales bacterium]|nr:glycosyltransferase family 2 protein [Opitutales bacterium]
MEEKLVSILIPVFNRENLVGKAIESAINQTYGNIEIIVVDNCSSDGTWRVLQEFASKDSRVRIFRNDENVGPVRNWHRCLSLSTGSYVKFLFSDDWIDSGYLDELMPFFDSYKNLGFAFSAVRICLNRDVTDVYNDAFKYGVHSSSHFIFRHLFFGGVPVSPGCAIFRREVVSQCLRESLENPLGIDYASHGGGIDLLLYLDVCKNYTLFAFSGKIFSYFRGGDHSFSCRLDLKDAYSFALISFLNEIKSFSGLYKLKLFLLRDEKYKLISCFRIRFFEIVLLVSFALKKCIGIL